MKKIVRNLQKGIDFLCQMWYNIYRKEVNIMRKAQQIIKELIKVMQYLNKLAVEIISLLGWILIVINLLE